ncbi:Lipase [Gossypium arboreum]|uniref:Lipase n=1 Tax=Gossypium arboreum TaxID=29729 RepID=A0A0B0MAZ3_GOSAR|nr:Lipase [Gossypium arboreum]
MIAAISPPPPTATLGPGRIRIPNSNRHSICFSNLGFLLWKPKLNWLSYERVQQMQMAWVRSMAGGCFKSKETQPELRIKVEEDSGGQDFFDPDAMASKFSPEHLVIMVNGLIGSAADWRFAAEKFVAKLPDKVIVHRSECNYSKLTFDGVDMMGGLVARYAIGRLYENSTKLGQSGPFVSTLTGEHTNSSMQDLQQHSEDRIAGLEPMNFITFATPHLGSRGHKQLPLLCGLPFLEKRASQTAHFVVGRSGKHLFLTDNDEGKPPLLLRMVDDGDDLKFISALHAFKRRVAYANANYDHMVGWRTSSIRRQNELPKSNLLVLDEKYPHVVYIERETTSKIQNKASSIAGSQTSTSDVEEVMIQGLNQVSWERVDVSFQKSKQRYVAHNTIQVKSYWLNSDGTDVVFHMIDNFLL